MAIIITILFPMIFLLFPQEVLWEYQPALVLRKWGNILLELLSNPDTHFRFEIFSSTAPNGEPRWSS